MFWKECDFDLHFEVICPHIHVIGCLVDYWLFEGWASWSTSGYLCPVASPALVVGALLPFLTFIMTNIAALAASTAWCVTAFFMLPHQMFLCFYFSSFNLWDLFLISLLHLILFNVLCLIWNITYGCFDCCLLCTVQIVLLYAFHKYFAPLSSSIYILNTFVRIIFTLCHWLLY